METTIAITPKFQLHIPAAIRQALSLTRPVRATIAVEGKRIIITPHKTSAVLSLAGTFKTTRTKKYPVDRIRDFISYER